MTRDGTPILCIARKIVKSLDHQGSSQTTILIKFTPKLLHGREKKDEIKERRKRAKWK